MLFKILGYVVTLSGKSELINRSKWLSSRGFTSLFDSLLYPSNSADETHRCCILGWVIVLFFVWRNGIRRPSPPHRVSYNWSLVLWFWRYFIRVHLPASFFNTNLRFFSKWSLGCHLLVVWHCGNGWPLKSQVLSSLPSFLCMVTIVQCVYVSSLPDWFYW